MTTNIDFNRMKVGLFTKRNDVNVYFSVVPKQTVLKNKVQAPYDFVGEVIYQNGKLELISDPAKGTLVPLPVVIK